MVTRWIPKKLLQVQGYFEGEKDVWLPGNLTIKSQHLFCNQNPDSARLREHNAKGGRINDGYQYHY